MHAREEESEPALPVPVLSYSLQQLVVAVAVGFEVEAEIEERLRERALRN
jgi:hypothetical protein